MKIGLPAVILLIILLTIPGCGPSAQKVKTEPTKGPEYIFYPPLPNSPKYQYLTTFSTSDDVKKKQSKFFKFVAGSDRAKPQAIKKAYGVGIHDGVIYVCDVSGGVITTLDMKNNRFGYIGNTGGGKLVKPINLRIDKENNLLYVADMGRKQVVCFDLQGNPRKIYGKTNQFDPSDVDFYKNKLFVCDVKRHQVEVLDKSTGETLYKIGKPGSKEGELFHPTNICVRNDKLYVSDTSNFRVQVFDTWGKFITAFGEIGDRPGNFSRGKGIDVDREERIYVVDAAFENVQVFDKNSQLLLYMFGPGGERHNINLPAGIVVDYDNLSYFNKFLSPKFKARYVLLVTSNFGRNKVNAYAFGDYTE